MKIKLTAFLCFLLTSVCTYSQTEQGKVSDTTKFFLVSSADIDSALVGFLLLDQCEEDRTTLTKGFADLQKVVTLKDQFIAKQKEDSVLQSEIIAEQILQQKQTEKILKKETLKKKFAAFTTYILAGGLVVTTALLLLK